MASIERLERISEWFSDLRVNWKDFLFDSYSDERKGGYTSPGSGCLKLELLAIFVLAIIFLVVWLILKDSSKAFELSIKIFIPLFAFQFVGYFIVCIIDGELKRALRKKKKDYK